MTQKSRWEVRFTDPEARSVWAGVTRYIRTFDADSADDALMAAWMCGGIVAVRRTFQRTPENGRAFFEKFRASGHLVADLVFDANEPAQVDPPARLSMTCDPFTNR